MTRAKQVAGRYDAGENVLHMWFPGEVRLKTTEEVEAFFAEVIGDWINKLPRPAWLLVDYANLHIAPSVGKEYARSIGTFQDKLLATFRYNVEPDFTGTAITLGNLKLRAPAHIFPDEAAAREALRRAKEGQ